MSNVPDNQPNKLPFFLTVVVGGVMLVLLLASFSFSWGTAYGDTIPGCGDKEEGNNNQQNGSGNFENEAFQRIWQRTDLLVANGTVKRTWIWGPKPGKAYKERHDDEDIGKCKQRSVQYFDKTRMEINNPNGDRNSPWYVTNGLLAKELISGNLQLGDNFFEQRQPAQVPVAGDQDDPNGPTYADLAGVTTLLPGQNIATSATGSFVNTTLARGKGTATSNLGQTYGVRYTNFDAQSGHNIAGPFWDFLNSTGLVLENGKIVTGKLFEPTFFATGLPLSEAYWVKVKVGGQVKDVLIQVFERRILTYTPSNDPEWRVEMSNIGQHYDAWRHGV